MNTPTIDQNPTPLFCLRYIRLFSRYLAVLLVFQTLLYLEANAQKQSNIDVSFVDNITVCGTPQTAIVTFTALDTLTMISGGFDLSGLDAIELRENSFSSADAVMFSAPNTFTFPNLLEGAVVSFNIDFSAACESRDLGGSNFIKLDVDYLIDGSIMESHSGLSENPGFSVTQPGLDFIMSSTDQFRPVINESDTIIKNIANAGDGDIDSALYFVIDHPNLSLCEIFIEGLDGAFNPTGLTYTLDLAGTNADTQFYWIGADALAATGNMDAIWNGLAGGQESFIVHEVWKGVTCTDMAPDIIRGIGYGCKEGSAIDLCTSEDNNSNVVFNKVPDLVSGQYDWGVQRPACYNVDATQVGFFVTNNGEAPADSVVVLLTTSDQGDIVTYRYSTVGRGGPYTNGLSGSTIGSGCAGDNNVRDTIFDANLDVGDSLFIQVEILYDCACNPSCGIGGIYRSDLDIMAIDRCGDAIDGTGASWSDYGVDINGFVEGPFEIKDGESGCITYTITSYRNNWFNNNYADSYYEMDFNFPAGLEIDNSSIAWEDASGDLFVPSEVLFLDGGPIVGDTIRVRWHQDMIPPQWSPGSGTQIDICFNAECDDPCGGETMLDVTAQLDFVIDPLCASCTQEDVFCPPALPMLLKCFSPGSCSCNGLAVLDLDINRVNFGFGDTDNDNCPETGEGIDLDLVETKRYLQGDTLKASTSALVLGSPMGVDPWINSTFQLATQTTSITAIGGEITIYDASETMSYTCDVLSMTISNALAGDTISIDLSVATLNSFCSSVPSSYIFEDGDSLALCVTFTVKEDFTGQQKPEFFETIWTVDDGINGPESCNQESDRLTQVGIDGRYLTDMDNRFGGCDQANNFIRERRFFGSENFDEFPFEVRPLGIPEEFVFIKPAEFGYSLDMFGFRLNGQLHGNVVNFTNGNPALAPYLLTSADTLTFKVGDYLRSLGSAKVPPDEGYDARFWPRFQGDCRSFAGFFPNQVYMSSSVEEITFCTPTLTRAPRTQNIEYTGGPQLLVQPDANNIVIDQPNQCLGFTLTNSTNIAAPNSFLYIKSPTGNVVINSLIETTGGSSVTVPPSTLGIFEIGTTPGNPNRTFEVCVTVNSCTEETLDFIAGWDCNQYPTTFVEATCQDPSTVAFSTGTAGLGLLVTIPTADTMIDLCDTIEYEVILNSTMAGSLRDINLSFDLPIGHQYVNGSYRYMWPQLPPSGFISAPDPANPFGNFYTSQITDLNSTLSSDGLSGNGFIPNNVVVIRFKTVTTCEMISGQAASFYASALNACGDPVNNRFFPGKRIQINGVQANYTIAPGSSDIILNPCAMDMATVDIDILVNSDPGVITSVGDTVRVILPPGVNYNLDSYLPGGNSAVIPNPIIMDLGGQQALNWPINTGLMNGALIQFSFAITASDVAQECRDYDLLIQTFSTTNSTCTTSGDCEIGVETGSARVPISMVKPKLIPQFFSGMLIPLPPNEEILMYSLEIFNNSTIGVAMGTNLPLKIFEDVDNTGTPTPGDILIGVHTVVLDSIAPGRRETVEVLDTFPSGTICRLIAVIDPDTACVCMLETSNQMEPAIKFDFPTDLQVCSNVDTAVGPMPLPGYDYTWLPIDGAFLGALDDPDTTQTTFQYQNLTGSPITFQYALRAISKSCFVYDTVKVTVFPETADTVDLPACMGQPILLPGPVSGSNFMWTPSMGLDDETIMFPTVLNPMMDETYSLVYTDENGCPAALTINVGIINCVSGTALGDTVWFDIDMDGIFDPEEKPIPGAIVLLFPANNPTGPHIRVDTTDDDGMYFFDDLTLGNYIVQFLPPPGFDFTQPDIGNDSLDSDADPTTGLTGPYFLNNGETNPTVDAGLISSCNLIVDLDISPCRASGDSIIRTATVAVDWTDAVYTYDFLFGEDTLLINYLGLTDTIIVDTLMGSEMITFTLDDASPSSFEVTAAFLLDTACRDTIESGMLEPCIFDLALIKELDPSGTSSPLQDDDTVKYLITVFNQGTIEAHNIVVRDHLGCGYTLIPNLGDLIAADTSIFIPGPIAPGGYDTACIYVRLQQPIDVPMDCLGNAVYDNYAEIRSYEDPFGDQLADKDSDPNSNSPQELETLPGSPGDNDTTSTDINGVGSEDDHDPATVTVFDLALRKTFDPSNTPPFLIGDTVKYLITIFGQGNVSAGSISIADTLYDGLEFIPALNAGWTDLGGNVVQFDSVLVNPLAFGDSLNICLFKRVRASSEPDAFLDMAKIKSAQDINGNRQTGDNDSPYDMNFMGNPGGNPGGLTDDYVGGVGTGMPNCDDPRGDLDSHDPAVFTVPVSVGDTTFVDVNLNGLQDESDMPLPGVTATLFLIDPLTGVGAPVMMDIFGNPYDNTRQTDLMGAYLFDSLPLGQYYVVFDVSTATRGTDYVPTQQNVNGVTLDSDDSDADAMGFSDTTDFLNSSESDLTLDGGWYLPVAVGDTVFVDANYNGLQDGSDPALEGVTITLRDAATGNIVMTDAYGNAISGMTITDADGFYLFDSLLPGTYYVEFDVSTVVGMPVLAPTKENEGGGSLDPKDSDVNSLGYSDTAAVTMSGDSNLTLDAGYFFPVVIGDTLFVDVNYDGFQDAGDLPLEGVTITLRDAMTGDTVTMDAFGNIITGMTLTDADGFYLFDSLPPGTYFVEFDVSTVAGMPVLAPTKENEGGGSLDPNDSDVNSLGYSDTAAVTMSGDSNLTLDAGYFFPVVIGDTLFVDVNYDGFQDAGDLPLEGVTITLRDATTGDTVTMDAFGNIITGMTLTDADGFYLFDSLPPGTYFVEFDVSTVPGMPVLAPTKENEAGGPLDPNDSDVNSLGYSDTAAVTMSGDSNLTLDAGYYFPVVLGDTVFVDVDYNGIQDPGEPPISGVTVVLLEATTGDTVMTDAFGNMITGLTQTDANGFYLFDSLAPGTYYVMFDVSTVPGMPLLAPTRENINGTPIDPFDSDINLVGVSDTVALIMSRDTNLTLDAGYFAPVSVGDTVWIDINEDGINDADELPIEGVTVTLFQWDVISMAPIAATTDAFGNLILPVRTDANGFYTFDSLPPGNYLVMFDVSTANTGDGNAANWQITYQNQGASDTLDSDADELTGFSDTTGFLLSGMHDPTLDAGFFPPRYDLALTKALAPGQATLVNPDDTVSMWIVVSNQGNVPSKKYMVNDILPSGMEFVDALPMPSFAMDSVVQWCDSLPDIVGIDNFAIDTFVIRAWINPVGQGLRDFQFRNWAEISTDQAASYGVIDEDSNPDANTGYDDDDGPGTPPNDPFTGADLDDVLLDTLPNDEDDSDFADLFTRRFDLALTKVLSPSELDDVVLPEDTVAFTIKIYNQGNMGGAVGLPADNIIIVDYIPVNLELVEENGWTLVNDSLASRVLEVGDELTMGGLEPDSCVEVKIRFVMNDMIYAETFNWSEIAHATDTAGIEILDFDSDLDSLNNDVAVDDATEDNAFEMIDNDGDGIIDEDDNDFARIISCLPVNCYANITLSLGPDCEVEVTPDMLLQDPRLALIRPDFYDLTLEVGNGIRIPGNRLGTQHRNQKIKASITWIGPSACSGGTCWTEITVKGDKQPFVEGTFNKTLYCIDPFLQLAPTDPSYPKPTAFQSCSNTPLDVTFAGEWLEIFPCSFGDQDTAQIIYREWAATSIDGVRRSAFDTITVIRPPAISVENTFCMEKDTIYCGTGKFGPFMLLPDICPDDGEPACDTLYFLNDDGTVKDFDDKCGLLVHVNKQGFGSDGCSETDRYTIEIKQSCYGITAPMNGGCEVMDSEIQVDGDVGEPIYASCEIWLTNIDTLPPLTRCKFDDYAAGDVLWPAAQDAGSLGLNTHCFDIDAPVLVVSTSVHDCAAVTLLPPLCVDEDWSGIRLAKATIAGLGTYTLTPTGDSCMVDSVPGVCYRSEAVVTIPKTDGPVMVTYEVLDSCYNLSLDTCYILVKDHVAPVAVSNKGLTISLASKKEWVQAEEFDEGSWDNCGLNLLLARRADWASSCVNFCDSLSYCFSNVQGDTVWSVVLEDDLGLDSVEGYYAQQLAWWDQDGIECGNILWNAWQYDLLRYGTQHCREHGYDFSNGDFRKIFEEAIQDSTVAAKFKAVSAHRFDCDTSLKLADLTTLELAELIDQMEQIGGGWSDQLPFDCSDACGPVTVELLVMDYWCNWSKAWTDVWVEDKTPVVVVRDVAVEVEISCSTYKSEGIDVVVSLAQGGDAEALRQLDAYFGGYEKGWIDPYGNYMDVNGDQIEPTLTYVDVASCTCTTEVVQVWVYDDHLGYIWKDSTISNCYTLADTLEIQTGIVGVNCGSNVQCTQEIWSELDHCGQGYIHRKWKMWQGCAANPDHPTNHVPDTITRLQRIWVGNNCELSKYMFTMPSDTTVDACEIMYSTDGSGLVTGVADPSVTGTPEYTFDDDCRLVGIARNDKVFRVVGGDEACFKIVRTWYVADWCGGKPATNAWWQDRDLVMDSFVQKIIVRDTMAPICSITGPVGDGERIDAAGCVYDFKATVDVSDECGIDRYSYVLVEVSGSIPIQVATGGEQLMGSTFEISVPELASGSYRLRVITTDACQNEGFCDYDFVLITGKKPAPVCVTSITASLVDMDTNNDGQIDTAMGIVWAEEFNASSEAACGSSAEELSYRIDILDGVGDDTYLDDTTYLEVNCGDVPEVAVRLWVIDPSGSFDFCDVILQVENNNNICSDIGGQDIDTIRANAGTSVAQDREVRRTSDGQVVFDGIGDAGLAVDRFESEGAFQLYQNRPNPFEEETIIGFYLPRAASATLRIYDVTGRILQVVEGDYAKGYQRVVIHASDLSTRGMIYYQVDTEEYTATKRMVLIN